MKQLKLMFLFTMHMSIAGVEGFAQESFYDFEVNGIYYRICSSSLFYDENYFYDGEVIVVDPNGDYNFSSPYEGNVYIPSSITIESKENVDPWDYYGYEEKKTYKVTRIASFAFGRTDGCSNLTSIFIPSSIKWIGEGAFGYCKALTNVTVDSDLSYTTKSRFGTICEEGETGLYDTPWYKSQPNGIVYLGKVAYGYKPYSNNQIISIKQGTERVGFRCFDGVSCINSIPNSIKSIGARAFRGCTFTTFSLPNNLTDIGSSAFANCKGLTDVIIPNNVKVLYTSTFEKCGLSSLTIGKGVKCILRNNRSIYLPYDGEYDYEYENLQREEMEDHYNWPDYTNILSLNYEDEYSLYSGREFRGFWGLDYYPYFYESPRYGLDVQTIKVTEGNTVFDSRDNCNAVIHTSTNTLVMGSSSTTIPNSVTAIGWNAFKDCSITNLTIPSSVGSIDMEAFRGSKLTSIVIPTSISTICICAFANCIDLSSIDIPNTVNAIELGAFYQCSALTSITIPSNVKNIGKSAFSGCSGLSSVISEIEEPFAFGDNAFYNISDDCVLTVPYGTRDAYIAAGWTEDVFKGGIVEMPEEDTDISEMDNVIYLGPTEAKTGSQKSLSIKMKNTAAIRGFQFDLYLPEGVTVAKTAMGKIMGSLSAGRLPEEDEHTLTFSEQADGAIRFLCSSQYDETFTGSDGEIATLTVNIADNMTDGDYAVVMKNMKLTETDISKYYETEIVKCKLTISSYTLGDINNDGVVDVSDYTGVANHIHGNTPTGFDARAADVDENGSIDVSDYTGIANIIHTGSIYGGANVRMAIRPKKQKAQENDPE